MHLLIYSPKVTPRIKYIFNFIFREILLCDFEFTTIATDFISSSSPKISYAESPLADELSFRSSSILSKHTIEKTEISVGLFGEQRVPFYLENSALPFDVFAASFYFLSRYEEYLPFTPDNHQRFPAEQSLQFQLGLLSTPIIDGWALILKNLLAKRFPSLVFGKREFEFIPTIDVDRAYHFRASGFFKNASRIFRAALHMNTKKVADMIKTGLGKNDPFDTYAYLDEIHRQYHLNPIFFFLLAKKGHEKFDQNISPEDEVFQNLIVETSKGAQVFLHTSYASNAQTAKVKEELLTLSKIIGGKIDSSRQHFLILQLPQTYLQLIKAGITHDYSMGYASQVGFRAGTCTPFFWYDLQLEKQAHLKIHPFAIMDVTLQQYLKLKPVQAIEKIEELLASVKIVDGTFCSLWHNESLSETGKWRGWKGVYEEMLKASDVLIG